MGGRTWGVYITSVKRCSPWSTKALLSELRAPVLSLGSRIPQTFTECLLCAGTMVGGDMVRKKAGLLPEFTSQWETQISNDYERLWKALRGNALNLAL